MLPKCSIRIGMAFNLPIPFIRLAAITKVDSIENIRADIPSHCECHGPITDNILDIRTEDSSTDRQT